MQGYVWAEETDDYTTPSTNKYIDVPWANLDPEVAEWDR